MHISIRSGLSVLLVCSISVFGCSHRPPWPPPLEPSFYADKVQSQHLNDTALLIWDVAGARIAHKGIYVDLVAHSKLVDESTLGQARTLGFLLSVKKEPEKYLQIEDSMNNQIQLLPMRRPRRLGFSHINYKDPPTYQLDDRRIIQVCMFRTVKQLEPGTYKIRFTEPWDSENLMGALGRPVSHQWRERSIDWADNGN